MNNKYNCSKESSNQKPSSCRPPSCLQLRPVSHTGLLVYIHLLPESTFNAIIET